MTTLTHRPFSSVSTPAGRGNYNTTYCGLRNYWGSGNPDHVPTVPTVKFAVDVEDVDCPDCILVTLGGDPREINE